MLYCEVAPPAGGETPFVPSFRVTERMLEEFPEVVEEMEAKGLKYTLTALSNSDTSSMRGRGWQDAFGTPDPAEAERRCLFHYAAIQFSEKCQIYHTILGCANCIPSRLNYRIRALGMDVEWQSNGAAKVIVEPRTLTTVFGGRKRRRMWFNTVVGMYGKELSSAAMADGTEIPEHVVKRCGEIIEEESIQFRWKKGDVLFFDNMALLHGRRPSEAPRRVLVATCK